ncbi:CinA family protein [Amphritea japonica]|uniref:Competence damage-inducible protein A n=1 Tax=Amphritea japonica ATCC BAA-1530 TaxID=1278309 RepID=A0A7R6PBK3_9GAMM|nr:CinA family protein [Amphritea japonica]BBB25121.1 competence damage-inducible protein A [Amphritea japonica ATCC BAA-1530]
MEKITLLVEGLAKLALDQQVRIATAESCTGGWIAQEITALAGSSEWFECGFVTYSNEAKQQMLGVSESLFISDGAVSESVVVAMAKGAVQKSRAQLSVAISGVAGPGGGTDLKPVGTVWIAWYFDGCEVEAGRYQFAGDRQSVRKQAVVGALKGLVKQLNKNTV